MKKTSLVLLLATLVVCIFTGCQSGELKDEKDENSTENVAITDNSEIEPMEPIEEYADDTEVDYMHITVNGKLLEIGEATLDDVKNLGFDLSADMDRIIESGSFSTEPYSCYNGDSMSFAFSNPSENDKKLSECILEVVSIGSSSSENNFSAYIWSIGSGLNQDSTYEDFLEVLGEPYDLEENTEENDINAYWKNDDWNTIDVHFDASNRKVKTLEIAV